MWDTSSDQNVIGTGRPHLEVVWGRYKRNLDNNLYTERHWMKKMKLYHPALTTDRHILHSIYLSIYLSVKKMS